MSGDHGVYTLQRWGYLLYLFGEERLARGHTQALHGSDGEREVLDPFLVPHRAVLQGQRLPLWAIVGAGGVAGAQPVLRRVGLGMSG